MTEHASLTELALAPRPIQIIEHSTSKSVPARSVEAVQPAAQKWEQPTSGDRIQRQTDKQRETITPFNPPTVERPIITAFSAAKNNPIPTEPKLPVNVPAVEAHGLPRMVVSSSCSLQSQPEQSRVQYKRTFGPTSIAMGQETPASTPSIKIFEPAEFKLASVTVKGPSDSPFIALNQTSPGSQRDSTIRTTDSTHFSVADLNHRLGTPYQHQAASFDSVEPLSPNATHAIVIGPINKANEQAVSLQSPCDPTEDDKAAKDSTSTDATVLNQIKPLNPPDSLTEKDFLHALGMRAVEAPKKQSYQAANAECTRPLAMHHQPLVGANQLLTREEEPPIPARPTKRPVPEHAGARPTNTTELIILRDRKITASHAERLVDKLVERMREPEVRAILDKHPHTIFENLKNAQIRRCVLTYLELVVRNRLPADRSDNARNIVRLAQEIGPDKMRDIIKRIRETPAGEAPKFHDFDSTTKFRAATLIRMVIREISQPAKPISKADKTTNAVSQFISAVKRVIATFGERPPRTVKVPEVTTHSPRTVKVPEATTRPPRTIKVPDATTRPPRTIRVPDGTIRDARTAKAPEQHRAPTQRQHSPESIRVQPPRIERVCPKCGGANSSASARCIVCREKLPNIKKQKTTVITRPVHAWMKSARRALRSIG